VIAGRPYADGRGCARESAADLPEAVCRGLIPLCGTATEVFFALRSHLAFGKSRRSQTHALGLTATQSRLKASRLSMQHSFNIHAKKPNGSHKYGDTQHSFC